LSKKILQTPNTEAMPALNETNKETLHTPNVANKKFCRSAGGQNLYNFSYVKQKV